MRARADGDDANFGAVFGLDGNRVLALDDEQPVVISAADTDRRSGMLGHALHAHAQIMGGIGMHFAVLQLTDLCLLLEVGSPGERGRALAAAVRGGMRPSGGSTTSEVRLFGRTPSCHGVSP